MTKNIVMNDPNKYWGPYQKVDFYEEEHVRFSLKGSYISIWHSHSDNCWHHYFSRTCLSSKEEAMISLDAYLENNGHILLTQEQFDKLKILI